MTSALEARPKLRSDVTIVRREHRGKVHYIVKQAKEQKYFQFGELEVGLMRLMDGRRTPAEIADDAVSTLSLRPPEGQVADFAQKLKRLGIVERTTAEQHLMLMERVRSERKVRAGRRTKGSILRIRFSIGDPDRLFEWGVKVVPWFWSPGFIAISTALFIAYVLLLAARWDEVWSATVGLATLSGFGVSDWVWLYVLSLVIIGIHELGHGLTTKYFGGEVHEIGGMLLYFSPALFCNTNDAWTFEKRAHRLWVTFAGPWIQLVIAALAAIVWMYTEPATLINRLAFLSVLAGGLLSVLTNFNPLIPLDGYYALSDWLEIPNLRRRAFDYWGWIGKRYILGLEVTEPPVTPRERRVFLIYGGLALAYSAFMIVVSLLWLILVIGRFLGVWIWALVAFIAARLIVKLAARARTLAVVASTTWRAGFLRGTRGAVLLGGAALLVALPFLLPWTFRARGEFRVEAFPRAHVRAQVSGILDQWHVDEGDTLKAGDPIATLWNAELASQLFEQRARAQRLTVEQTRAEAGGDRATASARSAALQKLEESLAVLQDQRDQLTVRAPIDGVVVGQRLQEQLGRSVPQGELLVEVAALEGRRARVRLPLKKAGDVAVGQSATLKLIARPNIKFRARVTAVAPAAKNGWLEAEIILPKGSWQPSPGMTGIAKIETRRGTIAQAIARAVRQTIRIDLWL